MEKPSPDAMPTQTPQKPDRPDYPGSLPGAGALPGVGATPGGLSQLEDRIRGGDRAALAQALEQQQRRLYNLVFRMVGHRDDAAEVAQEAMLKIVQHIHDFKGRSSLGTWMTRIAMNLALTFLRKRARRQSVSLDAPLAQAGAGESASSLSLRDQLADFREPPPGHSVEMDELRRQLWAGLQGLEDEARAVLVLRDVGQMDYPQIAEVLGIPLGTVKSRLFRARLALRQQIAHPPGNTPPRPGSAA
ncbi:MAG: sigma-70 family RNA polymerase sigma factor [Phycisphaeraceae bacterium]|nr:sigma-70 family RNA polymerase sigma factor [Phycisphaeraceae bacterium]